MEYLPITPDNRQEVNDFIVKQWSSTTMVLRGEPVDMTLPDGFTAVENGRILGLVTYRLTGDTCEIISLDSVYENQGIGTSLIELVKETAIRQSCLRLKLITTNDNIKAIRFYQKRGFDLVKLYHDSISQARILKPSIPITGYDNIPIRHELEFELVLHNENDREANPISEVRKENEQAPMTAINNSSVNHHSEKLSKSRDILIYTDGSARGNPEGPGGYGTILVYVDSMGIEHQKEYSGGYQKTTNNRMELMAAIVGFEALTRPCNVTLYSDSQYLVKAFQENWIDSWIKKGWKRSQNEPVKNTDLWKRLLKAMEPHNVTFEWVKGHNGHPMNERCDKLATTAADGENLSEDVIISV